MSLQIIHGVPNKADAIITFTGLLIVHFNDQGDVCRVGIHRHPHHLLRLKIEIRHQGNNVFDKVIWEHAYPPVLQQNLSIEVTNPDSDKPRMACFQHRDALNRAFPRIHHNVSIDNPEPQVLPEDYRWAMNLGWFHQGGLCYRENAFQPHIRLETGIFYASKLLRLGEDVYARRVRSRQGRALTMNPKLEDAGIRMHSRNNGDMELIAVAQEIGTNLYFSQYNGSLALRWIDVPAGIPLESLPPLPVLPPPPKDYFYRIIFDNGCREVNEATCKARLHRAGYGSDLPLYYEKGYNLLESMPPEGALDITAIPIALGEDFPCIPVSGP